jgi:hypothetical protein
MFHLKKKKIMDFKGISDALAYGRRIRRQSWPVGLFIESNGSDVWLRRETAESGKETLKHYAPGDRIFTFDDIFADDWVFYF